MDLLQRARILIRLEDDTRTTNPATFKKIVDSIKEMQYFTDYIPMIDHTISLGFTGEKFIKMLDKDFGGDAFKYGEHLLRSGNYQDF